MKAFLLLHENFLFKSFYIFFIKHGAVIIVCIYPTKVFIMVKQFVKLQIIRDLVLHFFVKIFSRCLASPQVEPQELCKPSAGHLKPLVLVPYPQAILKFHSPSSLDYRAYHGLSVGLLSIPISVMKVLQYHDEAGENQ